MVPITNGIEDIESVTIIDVFRRANINVTVAAVKKNNYHKPGTHNGFRVLLKTCRVFYWAKDCRKIKC